MITSNPDLTIAVQSPEVVFYVNDAWPVQAGYTIRTHYVASNLRKMGYKVRVCKQLSCNTESLNTRGLEVQPYMEKDGIAYLTFNTDLMLDLWIYAFAMKLGEYGIRGAKRIGNRIALPAYTNWIETTSDKPQPFNCDLAMLFVKEKNVNCV